MFPGILFGGYRQQGRQHILAVPLHKHMKSNAAIDFLVLRQFVMVKMANELKWDLKAYNLNLFSVIVTAVFW
jgi:hypothetical protein